MNVTKSPSRLSSRSAFKKFEELALAYQKVIAEVNNCDDLIKFHKQQSVRNSGDQFRRKLKQFIDLYNKQED